MNLNFDDDPLWINVLVTLITIAIALGVLYFTGFLCALGWNCVAPLFWHDAPTLSSMQALALFVLLNVLASTIRRCFK